MNSSSAALNQHGSVGGRGTSEGVRSSSSNPRGSISQRKVGGSTMSRSRLAAAREDARRRMQDVKPDLEGAIHVLDNGVNRTPVPLQQRQGGMAVPTAMQQLGGGSMTAGTSRFGGAISDSASGGWMMNSELGSSFLQSSFVGGNSQSSTTTRDRGYSNAGLKTRRKKQNSQSGGLASMDTSLRSLSLGGDHLLSEQSVTNLDRMGSSMSQATSGGGMSEFGSGGGYAAAQAAIPRLVPQTTLLDAATYEKPAPLTEQQMTEWKKSSVTIVLRETPTILLFAHQDEAVSNELPEEVERVQERNKAYAALEAAFTVDEGTRLFSTGVSTMNAPLKSIHADVQPPGKRDAGALQVTSWMLKDAAAANMEKMDEDAAEDGEGAGKEDEEGGLAAVGDGEEDGDDLDREVDGDMGESEDGDDGSSSGRKRSSVGTADPLDTDNGGVEASKRWMLAKTLLSTLRVMERAVVQNNLERVQLQYRGIEMTPAEAPLLTNGEAKTPAADTEGSPRKDGGEGDDEDALMLGREEAFVTTSADVSLLWCYGSAHLTQGRAVTCMAWNCKEPDMLAVGYTARRTAGGLAGQRQGGGAGDGVDKSGESFTRDQENAKHGMICCWSLKNPLAPELVLYLRPEADVSALAFSQQHPSLLAVGDTNGGVVIYDISRDVVTPSIIPAGTAGLHTEAVWELRWVAKGKEHRELLMSISADGRVVQWAVGKSIERIAPDLMHLQRQPGSKVEQAFVAGVAEADEASSALKRGKQKGTVGKKDAGAAVTVGISAAEDAVLSRECGGMCFDVSPMDAAVYIVGTEDGSVLQCSKSQTETCELEYEAHSELVYRIRWSPFSARFFLTCSADWTSRLYEVGIAAPQLRFHSVRQDAVQDVAWAYTSALTFATATAQGNVEIWSVMDAVCPRGHVQFKDNRRLSSVLFAEQETPVLVVGDELGSVTVYRLHGESYTRQSMAEDEQESWLEEAIKSQK